MREFAGDTWALLTEWGIWSREGRPALYGNSPMLSLIGSSGGRQPKITDDTGMLVDRVVARLKRREPRLHAALELVFVRSWSVRDIANELGVSRILADKLVAGAVAWVDSGLAENQRAA